nr:hypothetical protein Iba_chr08fCG1760 [Ipomoea batatas]
MVILEWKDIVAVNDSKSWQVGLVHVGDILTSKSAAAAMLSNVPWGLLDSVQDELNESDDVKSLMLTRFSTTKENIPSTVIRSSAICLNNYKVDDHGCSGRKDPRLPLMKYESSVGATTIFSHFCSSSPSTFSFSAPSADPVSSIPPPERVASETGPIVSFRPYSAIAL